MALNEKQKLFFKSLKQIKDANVEIYSLNSKSNSTLLKNEYKVLQDKLTTDEDIDSFKKIQNELVETVIYQMMELIDVYGMLEFEIDIYGYEDFIRTIDTVIMGRKTYEKVLSFGIEFPHKDRNCYVLSKTMSGRNKNVQFYNGDISELIKKLKGEEGKNIFIDGGSEVVRAFRNKNLIDEYIISIIPILLGKGIRLFKETENVNKIKFIESKVFDSGLVQLKYESID